MFIVHVNVHVKPEFVDAFREASLANARESLKEPGVARFDIVQEIERPERFMLLEVYRTPEDPAKHKETAHYQTWRDRVADMMVEPRSALKYRNLFPEERGWDTPA